MNDTPNPVQQAITDLGGYHAFAALMGAASPSMVRMVVKGQRKPSDTLRAAMARASGGRFTEADVIAITGVIGGSVPGHHVDDHWELSEDQLRDWIRTRAASAARAQRLANRSLTQ